MPKGKKKGKKDTLKIEFHLRIKKPEKAKLTAQLIREMIVYWVETGEEPGGVEIAAVTWQHTGKAERRADQDSGDLEGVRVNMLKRFIYSIPFSVQEAA
jgi:hypothetical protein